MTEHSEPADVEARVATVVAGVFGEDETEIGRETEFVTDLGASSVDLVALLAALEGEFGIDVPPSDIRERGTVGAAVDCIELELDGYEGY
jgi:acyl carrier protein